MHNAFKGFRLTSNMQDGGAIIVVMLRCMGASHLYRSQSLLYSMAVLNAVMMS